MKSTPGCAKRRGGVSLSLAWSDHCGEWSNVILIPDLVVHNCCLTVTSPFAEAAEVGERFRTKWAGCDFGEVA